jgi:hypothetical protein
VPAAVAFAASPTILRYLLDRGADDIDHPGGTLFEHVLRTAVTLAEWEASADLVSAGICHAAYGTDGFPVSLSGLDQRGIVRVMLGDRAESIVYLYAASDRAVTWGASPSAGRVPYRDRFTGERRMLSTTEASAYWTLTAANELDLLDRIPDPESILGPLERNREMLLEPAGYAVAAARDRHP